MSMISAQIDELRQMADGQATFHDAREVMLEAADTIWELRGSVHRERAEADRLRELCADMWRGSVTRMDFADRYAFIGEFVDRMRELGVEV